MDLGELKRLVHWAYVSLSHWLSLSEEEFSAMTVKDSIAQLEKTTAPEFPIDWYDETATTIQDRLHEKNWYHLKLDGPYLEGLKEQTWDDVITKDFRVYVRPKRARKTSRRKTP